MIDLVHIEHHHIIGSCFQNFNCHWLNNHQNSLTEFTYILRVLGSKIWPKYGSGFGKMQHILTGSGILQLPRKVDNYPGICQNLSMGCRIFFACLWGIRETIRISCKHESIRCTLSGVSLQTKSLIFPLQFFEFILLFLQTKCQEFEKNSVVHGCREKGAGVWRQSPLFQTLFPVKTCMAYWSAIIISLTGRLQFFFVSLFVLL